MSGLIQKILEDSKKSQENEGNEYCPSNGNVLTENSNINETKNKNIEVNKINTKMNRNGSNRAIDISPNKSIINKTYYSSTPINAIHNMKGIITKKNYHNYVGNGFERSQWSSNQEEKNSKSNEQSIEDKNKIKYRNTKRNINNKSLTGIDYRKKLFNMTAKKNEATKSIISKKIKGDFSLKKIKTNKIKNDKIRNGSKKIKSNNKEILDKITNHEESKIKDDNNNNTNNNVNNTSNNVNNKNNNVNNTNNNVNNTNNTNNNTNNNVNNTSNNANNTNNNANNTNNNNKGSFINANNKVLNLKSNNSLSNNNINNSNNNNNNNNNNNLYNKDRSHFSTKSFQYLNINSSKNITNINKDKERNISRGNTKKLTYYNTRPNIGFMKKQSMNLDDVVKKLSKKEQSYFILSRSPVLRLTERLFFGRSTANLRNVQTVTDILKKNERLLKNKKKELEGKLSECDKRINKVFNASKTAEINFNFILTKDEDELKSYIWFAENEKEKSEYYCYIKLLYLLFNEKYEKIELKHLTDKLYALINKKGHKTIKEYLYLIYFKKKENINIVYNIDNINHLLEESSVDINYNIKFCRFALFTSFLIKEIITYGNEIKNTVELKLKTKEFIDVINKKLELYKNGNYLKKIK